MILLIISIVLLFLYSILITWYRLAWKKIPVYTKPDDAKPKTRVSVIIPARNEEKNIASCLDSLQEQDFPKDLLEIIVVDDCSTDSTAGIASSYKNSNISLLSLEKESIGTEISNGGKKIALTAGIKKSSGALIITTDADCIFTKNWISTLVSFYETKKPVFIAAPVTFSAEKNTLHIFQSLDFLSLQGITAASVFSRLHMMCNGANLAYEKKVFEEVKGFSGIDHIASGDDMLLMHKIYQSYPDQVLYCLSPDAIVVTKPAENVKAFFQQRIRWASKALVYQDKWTFLILLLVYLLNFTLFIFLLNVIVLKNGFWSWVSLISIKTVIELIYLIPVARFFKKSSLLWAFFPAQIFHIPYIVISGFFGQVGSYTWKGRKLK